VERYHSEENVAHSVLYKVFAWSNVLQSAVTDGTGEHQCDMRAYYYDADKSSPGLSCPCTRAQLPLQLKH
jgi:hypothetical protein